MKRLPNMTVICLTVLLFSCSGGSEKTETPAADTTAVVATPPPPPEKPVFVPFKVMVVTHHVKNFTKWEAAYNDHDSIRKAYGLAAYVIGRDLKDSNFLYVVNKMEDLQKAKTFSTLPNLKVVMKKAGVSDVPHFGYGEVIRNDESPIDYADRLMVTHKVKDFAAWLKVFDSEGPATRAGYGMIDRVIARDLIDSNLVTLVFAVSDMAKAQARGKSPELKKIMTDAGVVGPPTIRWFRIVK